MAKSLKRRIARLEKMVSDFFTGVQPDKKVRTSAQKRPAARRKTKKAVTQTKRTAARKAVRA